MRLPYLNDRIIDTDSIEKKMKLFEDEENKIPDIILYGDIHKQYIQKIVNKTIVNVGSVGNTVEWLDYDENDDMSEITQAHYCIIEGEYNKKEKSSLSIRFIRLPYDINKEIELAKKIKLPNLDGYIMELTKAKYRGRKTK